MFLDAHAAAQDYWLQRIHVMAHRLEQVPSAVRLDGIEPYLGAQQLNDAASHPFRADLELRRANFKRRWTQNG
jgi:hypothetical protein